MMYQDIYNCICQTTKKNEDVLSSISNLQPNWCLKINDITVPFQPPAYNIWSLVAATQIASFMGPTWGSPGSCRPQMDPMLAPWNLPSEWNLHPRFNSLQWYTFIYMSCCGYILYEAILCLSRLHGLLSIGRYHTSSFSRKGNYAYFDLLLGIYIYIYIYKYKRYFKQKLKFIIWTDSGCCLYLNLTWWRACLRTTLRLIAIVFIVI